MNYQIKQFASRMVLVAGIIHMSVALSAQTKPDNTATNKDSKPTAEEQGSSKADTDITRRVRKAVLGDSSLSTYAHNVKIVTVNGTVTLKGPVRTDHEKTVIEGLAKEISGVSNVVNQLEVVPDKASQ